ncbi:MAG TPA: hypothetical protein PKK10_11670 [Woeseiaceae bacterium]|nr:hypothetical protein [Woeseiaceae bacterium]
MDNDQYYLTATKEFESRSRIAAKWAKVLAICEGDERKAKYRYIRERAGELSAAGQAEAREKGPSNGKLAEWLKEMQAALGEDDVVIRELQRMKIFASRNSAGAWSVFYPDGAAQIAADDESFHSLAQRIFSDKASQQEPCMDVSVLPKPSAARRLWSFIFWALVVAWVLVKALKIGLN